MNNKDDNNSGATFTFSGLVYNYGTMSGDVVNHFHDGKLAEAAATSENPSDGLTLMQKLIDHHFMDEQFQPIGLTWSERSILVDELSARLHIVDKWQAFGTLWHQKP